MDILQKIIDHKHREVKERKGLYPIALLEKSIYFDTPCVSMTDYLLRDDKSGIIAEFKRRSPSKGDINPYASVEEVSIGYMQAGASGLSVLTDSEFFGGKNSDLTTARKFNFCPILRKDFIIDEYQILEAKSIGADAILLIGECLEKEKLATLATTAKGLGLQVLFEIHGVEQLTKLTDDIDMVGINNRNLKTFEVDIQNSIELSKGIPDQFVKISESGISDPRTIVELKQEGFQGFLIGECFMKTDAPHKTAMKFVKDMHQHEMQLS
ncbi:MAG: indole-3-glycerol phosphate synthase TrpC [Bacteroidia bacterium]|nr:indole-3-glycerol phosphate synthase TrpC [Bacteroidia bacterium]